MLLGREPELVEIDRLLTDAGAGDGRALLIVGEAGIGKTALLSAARERAGNARVIEAAGIEAEASLPYAVLGEIAGPLLEGRFELPGAQSEAIGAALALGPAPDAPGDRFATCAALLALLASAAERQPLLVIVDDAHWLDPASGECLGYAARRLAGSRVALLSASRQGARDLFAGSDAVQKLELSGLDGGDARKLLEVSAPALRPTRSTRCCGRRPATRWHCWSCPPASATSSGEATRRWRTSRSGEPCSMPSKGGSPR